MALMPAPKTKPAKGNPGQFQNMEEWNAFTAFADGDGLGFGVPVYNTGQAGDGSATVAELADGEVFAGITRENIYTSANGSAEYADADKLGVADEGVILVMAGGAVTKGGQPFYDPSDKMYYGAAGAGRLPLPNCAFDQNGTANAVVPVRLRIVPGGEAVEAGA